MLVELYTKPGCEYCEKAKVLLDRYCIPYKVHLIGTDILREEVLKKFPNMQVAPIAVLDGQLLGTYAQLVNWISTTDFSK